MTAFKYKNGSSWETIGKAGIHSDFWYSGNVAMDNATGTPAVSATTSYMSVWEGEGDEFWLSSVPVADFTFSNLRGATGSTGSTGNTGASANCYAKMQVCNSAAFTVPILSADSWNSSTMRISCNSVRQHYYATSGDNNAQYLCKYHSTYGCCYVNSLSATYGIEGYGRMTGCTTTHPNAGSGSISQGLRMGICAGGTTGLLTGTINEYCTSSVFPSCAYFNNFNFATFISNSVSTRYYLFARTSGVTSAPTISAYAAGMTLRIYSYNYLGDQQWS